jgi:hypothetical protein
MKRKSLPVFIMLALMVGSITVNAILYQQNRSYRTHNRELILQNDSILSVNLELINQTQKTRRVSMVGNTR